VSKIEYYDVLVVGNDIGSLSAALFLARKMRKVAVFHDTASLTVKKAADDFIDVDNQKYTFKYGPGASVPGLKDGALLNRYLQLFNLENEIKSIDNFSDIIVNRDGSTYTRTRTPEQFLVYLVRHYPKQRDEIHRFFKDIDRMYHNFVTQQENMLVNRDYTLTSLMIEWGDYSLKQVLDKYFNDPELIKEFALFDSINGLDLSQVNSYNFFMNFFIGLNCGVSYLYANEQEIMKMLLAKISVINPKLIQNRKIKKITTDDSGKIVKLVDNMGKDISAKHYIFAATPQEFYPKYFPTRTAELEEICKYYPNLESPRRVQTAYICLNQKPALIGINDFTYYFKPDPEAKLQLTRMLNYKTYDPEACSAKNGILAIDFVYDEGENIDLKPLMDRLVEAFPKLAKCIVGSSLGKPRKLVSMLAVPEVRKHLSINEQIAIETGEHIKIFDNLYLIGEWLRPEAGLLGLFHAGILDGDTIEERLYYGEDDNEFYYLTNDEIMMMMRHNYGKKPLGPKETHINFHIGKSHYFVRTKAKNITVHRGEYADPDLTIYSTNDKLSNLLLKKTTFDEVLKSGGFKYKGKEEDLYAVVNAFNLDDYREEDNATQPKTKIKYLGVKFLFIYILIWGIMSFLSNFLPLIWLAPFAYGLILITMVLKLRTFKKISWFEIYLLTIGLATLMMAIFWPAFNNLLRDDYLLGAFAAVFMVSWVIDKPIVHDFHQFDYRKDYAQTALFKVINNGLTLVWALIFIIILAFTYVTGERYVSVLYNLIFLGLFLTYYYPVLYITANIKK